jgi:hypothetical protein
MSKHINDITNKVLQSNQDLYNGPNILMKEFESIRTDIKKLSFKIDQIYRLIIKLNNRDGY